jgi:hypothetical protein
MIAYQKSEKNYNLFLLLSDDIAQQTTTNNEDKISPSTKHIGIIFFIVPTEQHFF